MSEWISAANQLPPLNRVVMVCYPSGYDGSPVLAWGARLDSDDGWIWGVHSGFSPGISAMEDASINSIEADDEYLVQFWQDLPAAPTLLLQDRG